MPYAAACCSKDSGMVGPKLFRLQEAGQGVGSSTTIITITPLAREWGTSAVQALGELFQGYRVLWLFSLQFVLAQLSQSFVFLRLEALHFSSSPGETAVLLDQDSLSLGSGKLRFLYCFSYLYFIYLCSDSYFLPSADFGISSSLVPSWVMLGY